MKSSLFGRLVAPNIRIFVDSIKKAAGVLVDLRRSIQCNHIRASFSKSIAAMSKRINVMIDEDTWAFLSRVPAGERSRAINEALRQETERVCH